MISSADTVRDLEAILDLLETKGWVQYYSTGSNGEHCLLGAIDAYCGKDIVARDYYLFLIRNKVSDFVTYWNDNPGRTYEDVKNLLEEMIREHS